MREENGRVSGVFYPPDESLEVIAFKKSLAGLFSIEAGSSSSWSEEGSSLVVVQEVEGTHSQQAVGGRNTKTTSIDRETGTVIDVSLTGTGGAGKSLFNMTLHRRRKNFQFLV